MTDVNIGSTPLIATIRKASFGLIGIGALGMAAVFAVSGQERFFADYLLGFWYFAGISITMVFFTALQYLTRAGWSASVRRVAENFSGMVPWLALFLVPIIVNMMGHNSIYEWTHDSALSDPLLQKKAAYLNVTAFSIRMVVYCLLWGWMARSLIKNSLKQDSMDSDITPTRKNWAHAAPWVIVYALTISFAAFDLLMSLEPHWFSTIWGVYTFAGHFVAALSVIALMMVAIHNRGLLKGYFTDEHFHDMGKLMFAFSSFWAYIGFSQYFIIWYANIPEEGIYYTFRMQGGWEIFGYLLMLFRFVLPFMLLLRQDVKRKKNFLVIGAIVILIAHFIDIAWIILPAVAKVVGITDVLFGWQDFMGVIFFSGIFLFFAARQFTKNNSVPINDPMLKESMHYHT